MATNYTGSIKILVNSTFQNVGDLSTASDPVALTATQSYTDGTGANKAQLEWHDQRTLDASAIDDIDLSGAIVGTFGKPSFTKIKGILVRMTTTTTGAELSVGAAAANPLANVFGATTDTAVIGPGGVFYISSPVDGYEVVGGTGDILRVANTGTVATTYDIFIVGEGSVTP